MTLSRTERRRLEREAAKLPGLADLSGHIVDRQCVAPIFLMDAQGQSTRVEGLIDTGATATMLNSRIARAHFFPVVDYAPCSTANGVTETPVVMAQLALPHKDDPDKPGLGRAQRMSVGNLGGVDMLIGMDILIDGRLIIDGLTDTWMWQLRTRNSK